jgi:hypothetical protein
LEYALKLNSFIDSERKSVQYGLKWHIFFYSFGYKLFGAQIKIKPIC